MDPITLITAAITLATPYLMKTGEKLAEKVGEEIWNLIKKPFANEKKAELFTESPTEKQLDVIKKELIDVLTKNPEYKTELLNAVTKAQTSLNQQIINNNGNIEKQINIQNNSGDISF